MAFPCVTTPDEKLAALVKPPLTQSENIPFSGNDTLVICAGFEDRALASLRMINRDKSCRLLVIGYAPFEMKNRVVEITEYYQQVTGLSPELIVYNREDPAGFEIVFLEILGNRTGRVFVDVSAMSRLLIVQIIVALSTRKVGFSNCSIVYTEALEYPPSEKDAQAAIKKTVDDTTFSALFLSSGVFDVTVVPELSSIAPGVIQTRLVVFPAFDAHHLTSLRSELQPSRFTFIEGAPPSAVNAWRRDTIAAINHLSEISNAERIVTSTLDYAQTLDCLLDIYRRYSLHERILVAPTGSKMQSVAVGLFRAFIRDVQIVYPTPQGFVSPENYTKGCGASYLLPLDALSIST